MKKLSLQEKQIFAGELEMILSSGLGIEEGLQIIAQELPSQALKETVQSMIETFAQEGTFYAAVVQTQAFDPYMEQMVRMGELSGHLDEVLKELVKYYQRQNDMQRQLKEAATYPFILLVMMFLIVGIMVFKVLPIFEDVLASTGAMPSVMRFGMLFGQISFVFLFIVLLLIVIFAIVLMIKKSSFHFLMSFPLTRKLYKDLSLARLTYALSLFVSSGYPIEETIGLLGEFVDHPVLKKKIEAIHQDVKEGKSFGQALLDHQVYEGTYANMLAIGIHTGKQDSVLQSLGNLYEQEVEASTSRFLNIIEPTIIALLSIIVGVILLSIMLPLLGILSALG